ncbi:hypothetical protein ASE63_23420 [Bosea sp. Root381]|uniref:rhodanese-like domain-containing protein n=1 Tax=Bosea sp. Root381 TaxID=1736524 RepID=UPI0006F80F78|nr:rhodanese-like domain-containing protein [Bosea sp. Root381]KRE06907.1 hypothetical protein ASE63_23420 [Bosea sp. Root381]
MTLSPSRLRSIDVEALAKALSDGKELAIVDVREEGVRSRDGHLLLSVALPLSQIELRAGALLPRRDVRVVVTDAGDGVLADRAAAKLSSLGYVDIAVLDGGVAAWKASGREVYTGQSAYSKAFGEFVEHAYGTPHLSATELKSLLDAKADVVVLDGRTVQEFENFSIPGAYAAPNAELPLRVHSIVRSPETLVVVNCAGRTRSIIGAQALINAGLPNKVVALENGTMAWLFEGYELDHGTLNLAPKPTAAQSEPVRPSIEGLTKRFGLRWIDEARLAGLQAEADRRTLYLFDVRTQAEFEAGHLPGSLWAEGGQLVQGIDKFAPVRNSRIVVIDDELGARAAITASWLVQLGWGEVFALATRLTGEGRDTGPAPLDLPALPEAAIASPANLKAEIDAGTVVVLDLASSLAYEAGHIPGARFAVRSRLSENLDALAGKPVVLTSPDGKLARLAAAELALLIGAEKVRVLDDGTQAWKAALLPFETGLVALHHAADDVWRSPYQVAGDRHAAFRAYLEWEVDLLKQIERDADVSFKTFPALAA